MAREESGGALLEFAIAMPLVLVLVMGLIDTSMLLWHWTSTVKATQIGARDAVVRSPMTAFPASWSGDSHASAQFYSTNRGRPCLDSATGLANTAEDPADGATKAVCPTFETSCAGAACLAGFSRVLARMRLVQPRLQPEHVSIIYASSGLGYVGRPNGNPLTVTVRVTCLAFDMFFLDAWFRWTSPADDCGSASRGLKLGAAASAISEGMSKPAGEP